MMAAKIGIWLVWVFAVLVGMVASFVGAVITIPMLAMVVFSPALFLVLRRAPWAHK
ncbi:MAG: hypothetical protein NT015_08070 [Alphaproteobacteria bacterium]|nr:hypothetical protein [Alphaproteobacteria bacterium]